MPGSPVKSPIGESSYLKKPMTGIDIFLKDDRDTSQDPILSFITSIHVAIPLRTGAEFPGAVLL